MKNVYELYTSQQTYNDNTEYVIVIHKNGKRYGYKKRWNKPQAVYQHNPDTAGLKFTSYLTENTFQEMIFLDLL